jgi:acetyltransferase
MNLQNFFNPQSIAIVGISENPKKVGYLVTQKLVKQGYKGEIFLVNPKYTTLFNYPVYPNLTAIGKKIDLVVLAVPANVAIIILDEIISLRIKNVVLFAAGFRETNQDGLELEKILIAKCQANQIALLGPNCIGYVNTSKNINTTFLKHVAPQGNIGFISQSGALGSLMVDFLVTRKNLGFSYFVSLGNKAVIDESDVLEYLKEDQATQVIAMYLEDVKRGEKFKQMLWETVKKKPVVILKSGATLEGSKAAISHTGSMLGEDQVYTTVFDQLGAVRARSFLEFMALLKILSFQKKPISKEIMILSNAGGVGVLLTDELIKNKLSLVTVSEATKAEIIKTMGGEKITLHNPIDLLGDAKAFDYQSTITATLKEKNIGAVIVLLTPQANTEIAETASVIAQAQANFDKPIYPIFMGEKSVGNSHLFFEENKIASFSSYDYLPSALAKILDYQNTILINQNQSKITSEIVQEFAYKEIDSLIKSAQGPILNLISSIEVIKKTGIPVSDLYLVDNKQTLLNKAQEIGYPLVAKIVLDKITHKTEVKGVIANIQNQDELISAYVNITKITHTSACLLQKMITGYELILGVKRDPNFGVLVLVGLGGIYAQLWQEMVNFIYPFSQEYFTKQIAQSKIQAFIKGFRGLPLLDIKKLFIIASRLGYLANKFSQIKEIDINPLIVNEDNFFAVDARIVLTI